jgi:hypothetical protein
MNSTLAILAKVAPNSPNLSVSQVPNFAILAKLAIAKLAIAKLAIAKLAIAKLAITKLAVEKPLLIKTANVA